MGQKAKPSSHSQSHFRKLTTEPSVNEICITVPIKKSLLPQSSLTNQCSEISSGKRGYNFFLFSCSTPILLPLPSVGQDSLGQGHQNVSFECCPYRLMLKFPDWLISKYWLLLLWDVFSILQRCTLV